jgi:hypothetical protein
VGWTPFKMETHELLITSSPIQSSPKKQTTLKLSFPSNLLNKLNVMVKKFVPNKPATPSRLKVMNMSKS